LRKPRPASFPVPDTEELCESLKTANRDPVSGLIVDSFELLELTCCEFCEVIRRAMPPDWIRTQVNMGLYKIEISELIVFDYVDEIDSKGIVLCLLKDKYIYLK